MIGRWIELHFPLSLQLRDLRRPEGVQRLPLGLLRGEGGAEVALEAAQGRLQGPKKILR